MANDESLNGSCDSAEITPPVAFVLDEHLEFIDILDNSSNAYLLLGASNLVKKDWTGGIWYYDNPELAPRPENAAASMPTFCANAAGELIDHDMCIFGDDEGRINIYKMSNKENNFQMEYSKEICPSYISSLSLSPSKARTVIASSQNISLFENKIFMESKTYHGAHVKKITCVHWGPQDDTFISTSIDKTAILWDLRQSKPALAIYEDENNSLKSASWLNPNEVAIGTLSGELLCVDIRSFSTLHSAHFHKKPVHKMRLNSNTGYSNDSHKNVVRGLAWHPLNGQLYSCGYGAQIVRHELPTL